MSETDSRRPIAAVSPPSGPRAHLVELVGPAGVGKSTLCRELGRRAPRITAGFPLPKHSHLRTVVALLPTYLALHWPPRRLLVPEMKRITYLRTLRRVLARVAHRATVTILDEGPVYFHARALVYGGRRVNAPGCQRWWRRSIHAWAGILDRVVVLDAPDELLRARIRQRAEIEPSEHRGDPEAYYVGAYRRAYDRVLADLAAAGGPPVTRVDTSRDDVEAIAERLFAEGWIASDRARD